MIQAVTFLNQVVTDTSLQAEIRANGTTFEAVQAAAKRRGYQVTSDELNAALADHPVLLAHVMELLNAADMDFELSEAEMALISGGTPMCCNCNNGGPTYNPLEVKYI